MLLKGTNVSDAFYPFVENGGSEPSEVGSELEVRFPARIAVYDDAAAAPRVVVVEPTDIRSYLEEITATVTRLAQEQGGRIPFTVIREVVENLIHAYFIEPIVSILDAGNTIRFSDQGPGISDKQLALQYGTTSATREMKRYIRGVGSGLPYAQQWLEDKGGSLTVEDNIHKGTVVTITLASEPTYAEMPAPSQQASYQQVSYQQMTQQQPGWQGMPQQYPYQQAPQMPQQPYAQPMFPQQGYPQPTYQQPYGQPWPQAGGFAPAQPWTPQASAAAPAPAPVVGERGALVLEYLRTHNEVGPRDLNAVQPLSESTWSRELAKLEEQGLVSKQGGQKRRLTDAGRRYLGLI